MTFGLTSSNKKYWGPVPQVIDWLADRLPPNAKVLEIGPGHVRFPRATHFADFVQQPGIPSERLTQCDLSSDKLPFRDNSFDFVYCRHVLEDMYDPFPLCAEMSRVGKAGYIETPSPIAEMCRGVDGGSPGYRGYHHHRFMAWGHRDRLWLISKYPMVEYIDFEDSRIVNLLKAGPIHWNTYYLWDAHIKFGHIQNTLNYDMPRDYANILRQALEQSKASIDQFWTEMTPAKPASNVVKISKSA